MKHSSEIEILKLCRIIIIFFSLIIIFLLILLTLNTGIFKNDTIVDSTDVVDTNIVLVDINESPSDIYYENYSISELDNSDENILIKYGLELFMNTPNYMGPSNGNSEMVFAGNSLSCTNCHLLGGKKAYAGALIGVINRFPQYRGREDRMGSIEDRINGCMERSMNGRALTESSKEMISLVSYLKWLNRFAPENGVIEGQGFVDINIPDRPVDLANGEMVFKKTCVECHRSGGQGAFFPEKLVYQYPPLWGSDSFNNGAGMNRVITAAQFIKANMPYGATYLNPTLTDDEAYDVAGFINQQDRPTKNNLEIDFPNLLKKPVSTPYGPYLDPFSVEQHQMGPFPPIMQFYMDKYGVKKSN